MSNAKYFGPGSSVIKMNLALGQGVPSNAVYQNQLAQATANEFGYANAIANSVYGAGVTNLAFATAVLTNLGAGVQAAAGLAQAVADYISNVVGTANRGAVALQLTNILTNLTGDPTYGPIANNFNDAVSSGYEQATGNASTPGTTFSFTNNGNDALNGTNGNDTFNGNTATLQQGESINAGAGNDTAVLSLSGGLYDNFIASDLERIVLNGSGNGTLTFEVSNVGGLQSVGVANRSAGNVEIKDVQSNTVTLDLKDVQGDVLFQLDQQAAAGGTETKVSINEFSGALSVQGENGETIETLSLTVDPLEPFTNGKLGSVLKSVTATNNETLNIAGGSAGKGFKITGPLDSTLKLVNASTFAGDLDLNATANAFDKAIEVRLGSGNDKLDMGDGYGDGDKIDGGVGADQVTVNFTTADDSTRDATMVKVETLNATFAAAVSFEGANVDDLATINLKASSSRADFNDMDQTLTTLNIQGNLDKGVEVDYDGTAKAVIDINITDKTSKIGNAGNQAAIRIINADTVQLDHDGTAAVTITNGLQVDDTFTGRHTSTLTINNNSVSDLTIAPIAGATAVQDGNTVSTLTIATTNLGDLTAGSNTAALMEEADGLRKFTVTSSTAGDITLGAVGTGASGADGGAPAADNLETVAFSAGISSVITQWGIDADDSFFATGNSAATPSNISIKGAASSRVNLFGSLGLNVDNQLNRGVVGLGVGDGSTGFNWLQAASIKQMQIDSSGEFVKGNVTATYDISNGGAIDVTLSSLIGLDFHGVEAGSRILAKGTANVTGLYFHDQVVDKVDASGLTGDFQNHTTNLAEVLSEFGGGYNSDVRALLDTVDGFVHDGIYSFAVVANDEINQPATTAIEVLGSQGDDWIAATNKGDKLSGNGGNDLIIGYAGNDSIDGGDGDDILWGDDLTSALGGLQAGNDTIKGGAGDDIIIGGRNVAGGAFGDVLTGGDGNDGFVFHFDTVSGAANLAESGKSTNALRQDAITDFSPGADKIFIDVDGVPDNNYVIAYYEDASANGQFFSTTPADTDVQVVVRRGNYQANGTFVQTVTGADYQVLFLNNGADFAGSSLVRAAGNLDDGGGNSFVQADHEIAVLGLAHSGSLSTSDIVFI